GGPEHGWSRVGGVGDYSQASAITALSDSSFALSSSDCLPICVMRRSCTTRSCRRYAAHTLDSPFALPAAENVGFTAAVRVALAEGRSFSRLSAQPADARDASTSSAAAETRVMGTPLLWAHGCSPARADETGRHRSRRPRRTAGNCMDVDVSGGENAGGGPDGRARRKC